MSQPCNNADSRAILASATWHPNTGRATGAGSPVNGLVREIQDDSGSAPELALRVHAPAVRFHEMLHDRQAESCAAFLAGATGVDAVEPLENAGQLIGGNAGSRIGDPDQRVDPRALGSDTNAAARGRMPQRVVEQVREDLPQRFGVAVDRGRVRGGFECDAP